MTFTSGGAMEALGPSPRLGRHPKHPDIILCPTLSQTGEGSPLHEETARHEHIQVTPQVARPRGTQQRDDTGVSSHTGNHTGTTREHWETRKDAYSIPHPVPPKITPRARMVPATAPISLLVAMFTVWREKRRFFLTEEMNDTLISLTYQITSSGNAWKVNYILKSLLDDLPLNCIHTGNIQGQFWIYLHTPKTLIKNIISYTLGCINNPTGVIVPIRSEVN